MTPLNSKQTKEITDWVKKAQTLLVQDYNWSASYQRSVVRVIANNQGSTLHIMLTAQLPMIGSITHRVQQPFDQMWFEYIPDPYPTITDKLNADFNKALKEFFNEIGRAALLSSQCDITLAKMNIPNWRGLNLEEYDPEKVLL